MGNAKTTVAIVGGGLAGMATALRLKQAGIDCLLIEAAEHLGGKLAGIATSDNTWIDAAPSNFMGRYEVFWQLIAELGLSNEVIRLGTVARTRYVARANGLRRGLGILPVTAWPAVVSELWRRNHANGEETVEAFLRRRFGVRAAETLGGVLCAGTYGGDPTELSIGACFPLMAEAERARGSLILGMLRATKPAHPGTYTLTGGLFSLARVAEQKLAGNLCLASKVVSVEASHSGFTISLNQQGNLTQIVARELVLATEANEAARLTQALAPELSALLGQFTYAKMAAVHWREEEASLLPRGFGYLAAADADLFALGTVFQGDLRGETPRRFSSFIGGIKHPERVALSDQELVAGIAQDLEKLKVGRFGRILAIARYEHAVVQPTLGHAARVAQALQGAQSARLHLAGSYLQAGAMKDAIASGLATASNLISREQESRRRVA